MGLNIYKYFQTKEKWQLFLESIEYRLSKLIPENIKIKRQLLLRLQTAAIPVKAEKNGLRVSFRTGQREIDFFIRNESSDANVFFQIIFEDEYRAIIDLFNRMKLPIKSFIDAGANTGFSSLYLFAFFPEVRFVCLEPNPENFKALSRNVSENVPLGKYTLLQKALWDKSVSLSGDHSFRDGKDWSFSVRETSEDSGSIKGTTMSSLMDEYDFAELDFLKIDIEGAEAKLFDNRSLVEQWISDVKVLSIEIHDETNARFNIENLLQDLGFRIYHSGEITIAVNRKLIHLLTQSEKN